MTDPSQQRNESSGPPATWSRRLRFGLGWLGLFVVTVVIAPMQIIAHYFNPTARTFKRWAARWGRWSLRSFGVQTRLIEQATLDPDQPYVLIANHQNLLDILALAGFVPHPFGFLAKAELERIPFLGIALRHSASILIDRSTPRRSVRSLQQAGQQIREGHSVLVYPEGSRSYTSAMGPFQKGAFRIALEAEVPLVPVVVRGAWRLADERCYAAQPGTLEVVVGTPIATGGLSRSDLAPLMRRARRVMAEMQERGRPTPVAISSS